MKLTGDTQTDLLRIKCAIDKLQTEGVEGKSAYEIAVENGFVGTEEEWLASLEGPTGPPGEPGTGEDIVYNNTVGF